MFKYSTINSLLFTAILVMSQLAFAGEGRKFRVVISTPAGTTLSGFNHSQLISCDGETNSGHFNQFDKYFYVRVFDSKTGVANVDSYTRGVDFTFQLLDCDKPLIDQRISVNFTGHYLGEMRTDMVRPIYNEPQKPQVKVAPPKSVTKQTPVIKTEKRDVTLEVNTTGKKTQLFTIADTVFSISIKRI